VFPLKYYPADSALNSFHLSMLVPPRWGQLHYLPDPGWLAVYLLVPFVYLPLFVLSLRKNRSISIPRFDRLLLISLVGFFIFLGAAPAPVEWRMCIVAMPGFILLGRYLSASGRLQAFIRWSLCSAMVATAVLIVWKQQTRNRLVLRTQIGSAVYFDDAVYQRMKWVADHTHRGDPFFDCSGQAYFLMGLRSPAQVSFVTDSDYLRPSQVQDLVESLEREQVRVVLWCPGLNLQVRRDDHLAVLRSYLQSHYLPVEVEGNPGAVLRRNSD
jgi:hypothetical protein